MLSDLCVYALWLHVNVNIWLYMCVSCLWVWVSISLFCLTCKSFCYLFVLSQSLYSQFFFIIIIFSFFWFKNLTSFLPLRLPLLLRYTVVDDVIFVIIIFGLCTMFFLLFYFLSRFVALTVLTHSLAIFLYHKICFVQFAIWMG